MRCRLLRSLAAACVAFTSSASTAQACSCMRVAPEVFRQQASVIVVGKVRALRSLGRQTGQVIAMIDVEQRVKGRVGRNISVATAANGAACGIYFKVGERREYLLQREQGRLRTDLCLMLGARRP